MSSNYGVEVSYGAPWNAYALLNSRELTPKLTSVSITGRGIDCRDSKPQIINRKRKRNLLIRAVNDKGIHGQTTNTLEGGDVVLFGIESKHFVT